MAVRNDLSSVPAQEHGKEMTTKEKIFEVALDLFAQKGYDAVSMREIAEAVGIKKASLYSHFSSKDELLEKLFEYPMAKLTIIAPASFDAEKEITSMGVEGFMNMATGVFNKWIEGPEMDKVWRIICIELYHSEAMKVFYYKFSGEAIAFWKSNFEIMMKHKLIKPSDSDALAMEYLSFYLFAFMDYFIVRYGTANSFLDAEGENLEKHIKFLVKSIKA